MSSIIRSRTNPQIKFTIAMGKKIRLAREEYGLSQADLAEKIFRRRATVSEIETGKSELGTITLSRISYVLEKPITYFFPDFAIRKMNREELSSIAQELLLIFESLDDDALKSLAIKQVRNLSEFKSED